MEDIRIGIVGIGNCASSLLQGIDFYRHRGAEDAIGILFWDIGGYTPAHIRITSAFDIDKRKVGRDVNAAIFAKPNCTQKIVETMEPSGVTVQMGKALDGFAEHMRGYDQDYTYVLSNSREAEKEEIVESLKRSRTEILLNYLPVGSQKATEFYAECALQAGVAFINNIPVFLASEKKWAERFAAASLPIVGDDIKSQLGATIIHRTLVHLFAQRGVRVDHTYQMNTGGNTDFLNMKDMHRLTSKKISKTEAVKAVMRQSLANRDIHIGPSDYVPWLKDNKVAFIRIEGRLFGDIPMNLELRLSVEDSPNSAGSAIDCIRLCKLAMDRGVSGPLLEPSSLYCKHPPQQFTDEEAFILVQRFIDGGSS